MIEEVEVFTLPNAEVVYFYPGDHRYVIGENGKEVPSITQLIKEVYGNSYQFVKPDVLQRAAEYGTKVHSMLDELIQLRTVGIDISAQLEGETPQEVRNYFNKVEPLYNIVPVKTEQVVVLYNSKGDPIAAGRFDILCKVDGNLTLADFKTTSTIMKQSVTAQLNLYLKAAVQSGYLDSEEDVDLGVIHLSGSTAKYNPVTKMGEGFYKKFIKD